MFAQRFWSQKRNNWAEWVIKEPGADRACCLWSYCENISSYSEPRWFPFPFHRGRIRAECASFCICKVSFKVWRRLIRCYHSFLLTAMKTTFFSSLCSKRAKHDVNSIHTKSTITILCTAVCRVAAALVRCLSPASNMSLWHTPLSCL